MSNFKDRTGCADVYADDLGDQSFNGGSARVSYLFLIDADAEPSAFGRVANVFTIANVAPETACLERRGSDVLHFAIELAGISAQTADSLRRKLMQLTSVSQTSVRAITMVGEAQLEPRDQ